MPYNLKNFIVIKQYTHKCVQTHTNMETQTMPSTENYNFYH